MLLNQEIKNFDGKLRDAAIREVTRPLILMVLLLALENTENDISVFDSYNKRDQNDKKNYGKNSKKLLHGLKLEVTDLLDKYGIEESLKQKVLHILMGSVDADEVSPRLYDFLKQVHIMRKIRTGKELYEEILKVHSEFKNYQLIPKDAQTLICSLLRIEESSRVYIPYSGFCEVFAQAALNITEGISSIKSLKDKIGGQIYGIEKDALGLTIGTVNLILNGIALNGLYNAVSDSNFKKEGADSIFLDLTQKIDSNTTLKKVFRETFTFVDKSHNSKMIIKIPADYDTSDKPDIINFKREIFKWGQLDLVISLPAVGKAKGYTLLVIDPTRKHKDHKDYKTQFMYFEKEYSTIRDEDAVLKRIEGLPTECSFKEASLIIDQVDPIWNMPVITKPKLSDINPYNLSSKSFGTVLFRKRVGDYLKV